MDVKQIKKNIEKVNLFILSAKAMGGYKYRQMLKGSDKEIQDFMENIAAAIKTAVVSIHVAEEMLKEPGYWDRKTRWEEYQQRVAEAIKEVSSK